jgi:hypothetical protein
LGAIGSSPVRGGRKLDGMLFRSYTPASPLTHFIEDFWLYDDYEPRPVPDGAVLAKIEWQKARASKTAYGVTVPGTYAEVSFMLKDSKRFPNTNGWGYATFRHDAASDMFKTFGDVPEFVNACHACHTIVRDSDVVFTTYANR